MQQVPSSAREARDLGLKSYFTGVPCKRGGVAYRRLNGDCLCEMCSDFYKKLKAEWAVKNYHKHKEWAAANSEKMKQYKKKYADKNKVAQEERVKNWKANNKHKIAAYVEKRRSIKLMALPSWYSEFDSFCMEEAHQLVKLREQTTGIKWSVDHKIPLQAKQACGLHCADNVQVIPASLNYSKMHKMMYIEPSDWIKKL